MSEQRVWVSWARLVRIPTVFTILADVSAGFFLVAHGHEPIARWLVVLLAAVCLYWAGMIFNDVFDVEQDRRERPTRPLPAGEIPVRRAATVGGGLLVLGVVLAGASGWIPAGDLSTGWWPLWVAAVLAVMVLLYDGPLKRTLLAPAAMGSCRFLSFLLGASPALPWAIDGGWGELVPQHVLGAALGMGVYVMGVTLVARHEAAESHKATLAGGLVVMALGLGLIAFVPRFAEPGAGLVVRGDREFALLIGMLGLTIMARGINAVRDPEPRRVQMTVRAALLTLIPLSAALAFLGAGPVYGLGVFALVIPAMWVGAKFRMT